MANNLDKPLSGYWVKVFLDRETANPKVYRLFFALEGEGCFPSEKGNYILGYYDDGKMRGINSSRVFELVENCEKRLEDWKVYIPGKILIRHSINELIIWCFSSDPSLKTRYGFRNSYVSEMGMVNTAVFDCPVCKNSQINIHFDENGKVFNCKFVEIDPRFPVICEECSLQLSNIDGDFDYPLFLSLFEKTVSRWRYSA